MSEKRLLNLSNKVHVLNTEVSHLQAKMKKLREDMDGNSDKIDQVDVQLKQIANDLEEIEQWVADEEQEERLMRKKEIESDIERRSDWRSLWIAIISTGLGGGVTLIAQYLFF